MRDISMTTSTMVPRSDHVKYVREYNGTGMYTSYSIANICLQLRVTDLDVRRPLIESIEAVP